MLGKQLTVSDFQQCKKVGMVFHCPNMNLLNKNLEILCLYNLFTQTTYQIEKTCKVDVSLLRSHAVQVSASMYRIMTDKPIMLTMDCKNGHNSTIIRGIFHLQLSDECPKASTPDHLFVRTPDLLLGTQELIALPLLSQSKEWLGEINRELDLSSVLESIDSVPGLDRTVPLRTFREHIHKRTFRMYKFVEGLVIAAVTYSVLTIFLVMGVRQCCQKLKRERTRRRSARDRPQMVEFSDSDGGLMNRQAVPMLPRLVRRQWQNVPD